MAFTIPNLDRVQKADPKLGESLQKIQKYVNQNVAQTPGNRVPKPPIDPTTTKT